MARFSIIASMMTSLLAAASARSSSRLPAVTSVSKRGEKNAAGLALRAAFEPGVGDLVARLAGRPRGASLGTMSSSRTRRPALPRCAAMAAPITPAPSTVTSRIADRCHRHTITDLDRARPAERSGAVALHQLTLIRKSRGGAGTLVAGDHRRGLVSPRLRHLRSDLGSGHVRVCGRRWFSGGLGTGGERQPRLGNVQRARRQRHVCRGGVFAVLEQGTMKIADSVYGPPASDVPLSETGRRGGGRSVRLRPGLRPPPRAAT